MERIEAHFNDRFRHWNVRLPAEDLAQRRSGKIVEAGWAIWYLFGSDEGGEYLDYYSAHRMTSDDHYRVYANGKCQRLPVMRDMRMSSADPEEDARLDAAFYADNERIAEMLHAKGFNMRGDEPGGVQMNRLLRLKRMEDLSE